MGFNNTETTFISKSMVEELISSIGLKPLGIRFIKYSQNFLYEITDNSGVKILRITSDKHRAESQIKAELQWIDFLKAGGVNACAAVKINGEQGIYNVETPEDTLHCVVFEKAQGKPLNSEMFNEELYFLHGATTGKIHRLTRTCPFDIAKNRFNWQDNRLFTSDIQEHIPEYIRQTIFDMANVLIAEALSLPKTGLSYGLIHFDLHYDNFYKDAKNLWLFDFDNCSNGYFINDIAKALWSSVFTYHRVGQFQGKHPFFDNLAVDRILESIWTPFWSGYCSENEVDEIWFEQIPLFFEIIHLKEFVHHYRQKVPYRSEELRKIFALEQKQIEQRIVPLSFDFRRGKAIPRKKCF